MVDPGSPSRGQWRAIAPYEKQPVHCAVGRLIYMRSPHRDIKDFLAALRAACNRTSLLEAGLFSTTVLALTAVLGLLCAALVAPWLGITVLTLGMVVSVVGAWRIWWRPRRARASDTAVARFVEHRLDGLFSGVVTAVETRAIMDAEPDPEKLGFSPRLAEAAADRAAQRLREKRPSELVVVAGLHRMARIGFITLLALTPVVLAGAPTLTEGWAAIIEPSQTAEALTRGKETDVFVRNFNLQIQPPPYLDLELRDATSLDGAFRAVRGSEVRYVATADEAVAHAVIVFESQPDARWPVSVRDGVVVEGRMRLGASDRYRFVLTLNDGAVIRERRWRAIAATNDEPPSVRLLLPNSDLEVHADDDVALLFEASDDYGLKEVNLVVTGSDGAEALRATVKTLEGARGGRGTYSLPVSKLDLSPGQSVQVAFEARDINTLDGPGVTYSAARTLTMYSPEKQHEELLSSLKRLIDGLVDVIADRLESPVERQRADELVDYIATQFAISKREATAVAALETLSSALGADPLADTEFRNAISSALKAFKAAHEQEAAQLRRAARPDRVAPRAPVMTQLLYTANNEGIDALESVIFELKRLLDKARQDRVLKLGREMLEVQNELRQLLEKAKEGDADARRRAMAKLAELQSRLRRMQREMIKMAERVPYENQNLSSKAAGEYGDTKSIGEQMAKVEQLLQQGRVDEAMKLLEELNRDTQELMAGLQSDFNRMKMTKAGRKRMGEFQQQLGQVADGQRGLMTETGQLRRSQLQKQTSEIKESLAEAVNEARALAERLRRVEGKHVNPRDRPTLEALKRSAARAEEQLKRLDPEAAEATSREVANGAGNLAKESGEGASRQVTAEGVRRLERAQRELDGAAEAATKLADRLQKMLESAQQGPAGPQAPAMKRLGKRQSKLAKRLGGLDSSLESLDKELPGVRNKLRKDLEKARENMKAASKELKKGKGRKAQERQDAALERLDSAMRSLDESMKRRRGNASEQSGVNDPRERVVIPGDEAVPRRFRQELLKAMKERAPKKYRKRIDRYYKDLVK